MTPSGQAYDTDTTSSSSSSGPAPIRRPELRTITETGSSPRGPILEGGAGLPSGGPNFATPLPPRARNPRDILKEGEKGFIVDLKLNLEVEVYIKATLMGDLTLSVL
ncbi:hypothetical protein CCHL11_01811 [Colletotrichum chlorophyti]|uniref:Uncharacterized protein n=1 Tax=Colletotrichum chlorophyti TaxID=708187 RepID=A0A1Q8RVY0_9PEZI|nr:hypothetical protein CCHL11_01811 [Colletotrichum chlorophyti]